MQRRALAVAVLTAAAGCAHLPIAPSVGLVDRLGRPTQLSTVVPQQAGVAYLLVGEDHSNACDHGWEAQIVQAMGAAGPVVVGLEMVAVDQQPVLDRFNAGSIDVSAVGDALNWDKRWGFPFAIYRPIFEAARQHSAPVVALNAPNDVEHIVGFGGLEALTAAQRQDITPELIPPPPEEEEMLKSAMASHGGRAPNKDRFLRIQSLWDTQMAYRAVEAHRRAGQLVIVIAGGGHVEHGWGIAHRLRRLDPGARITSIMPVRPGDQIDGAEADLFFSCPSID